ncbi:MAG: hypothetical protein AAGA58_12630 [Verrucomicrobiota bacterium]
MNKVFLQLTFLHVTFLSYGEVTEKDLKVVTDPDKDYLLTAGYEFDVEGGGYITCEIDLDRDGIKDRMFANAATSGTGGIAATVYLGRDDGQFIHVGSFGHGFIAREVTPSGRVLLHCSWDFGGGHSSVSTFYISHKGLEPLSTFGGHLSVSKFQKKFESTFAEQLLPEYKFVAKRPEKQAKKREPKTDN